MTLGEGKEKVYKLLDEHSSGGEVAHDADIEMKMADFFDIAQKKCATCRWWSGSRKVIFVGADPKFVRIQGLIPGVACRAWDGRKYGGGMTCFRWSKWEKL